MGEPLRHRKKQFRERRKYTRFQTNLYITYSLPGKEARDASVFITKNMSGGGILFESLREITVGTVFDLFIHLPTTPYPLTAKGKVVRVENTRSYGRYDIGMSIVEIFEKDRQELIKYLISTMLTRADCEILFEKEGSIETNRTVLSELNT